MKKIVQHNRRKGDISGFYKLGRFISSIIIILLLGVTVQAQSPMNENHLKFAMADKTISKAIAIIQQEYLYQANTRHLLAALSAELTNRSSQNRSEESFAKALGLLLRNHSGNGYFDVVQTPLPFAFTTKWKSQRLHNASITQNAGAESTDIESSGIENSAMLTGNIGFIKITDLTFHRGFIEKLAITFKEFSQAQAIIIDVTEVEEGSFELANYLLSIFIKQGELLSTIHVNGAKNRNFIADKTQNDLVFQNNFPLYVLTSAFTRSMGEYLAYTLKHFDKAVIIGKPTMGIAHWVEHFALGNNMTLTVPTSTVTHPVTLSNWEGDGVQPDFNLERSKSFARAYQLARKAVALPMQNTEVKSLRPPQK